MALKGARFFMEILLLLALVLLNGIFAMTEIALITSKRAKLQKAAEAGDSSAQLALTLAKTPTGSCPPSRSELPRLAY